MTKSYKAGAIVQQLLRERGWTQGHLARLTGIPQPTISRIISGRQEPNAHNVRLLAEALGVSTDYLLGAQGRADVDMQNPPFEQLLNAAGEWSEARELELRRLWPAMTPTERRGEVTRLRRLAELRAQDAELQRQVDALRAEVQALRQARDERRAEPDPPGQPVLRDGKTAMC